MIAYLCDFDGNTTLTAYNNEQVVKSISISSSTPDYYTISGVGAITKVVVTSTSAWVGSVTYDIKCPDCSGINPIVKDVTFTAGMDCTCTGDQSLTIGPNVMIKNDARVTFKAPRVRGTGFHAEKGAVVNIKQ